MAYDEETIAAIRAQADRISKNQVIPRGTRQYAVIWNGLYQLPHGSTAKIAYTGTIWYRKDLTAHQRFKETMIVIDGSRAADPNPLVVPKGMPDNTLTTFFQCVPDRTWTGHYWAATRRDARAIWNWLIKQLRREEEAHEGTTGNQ